MSDIRALLFDVFGTVVDWRGGIAREAAPFLARHGIAMDPHVFADAWRARYQPAMQAVRSGARPFARLDTLHRENLDAVLRDAGADPARIPVAELDALNRAWHRLDPWPDSVAGLTRLKSRFVIAPLSNGNVALLLNMAKRAGLPWDAILGAEVAQAYKPQPEAYLRTAEILGLPPSACMMVAAHNDDLAAAGRCGLATAFVARPTEHGPSQTTDLAPAERWDVVATDFNDLADRLGCA
ncbi:haloacid dehalogenase type II [Falsiroseomonas oryziterrae]|uniref:haloacid dehalogenase type II n=1 Tax=Falsiroseomonas oryziterrae TaxID=2911368 RepID=UPI001EFFA4B4|nr:haloacid dehalogenase type II [Roseomonas sp. NPKOSM-4]